MPSISTTRRRTLSRPFSTARAARHKFEEGATADEISALKALIKEIQLRAGEPDRELGEAAREGMGKARETRRREHAERVATESREVARQVAALEARGLSRSSAVTHIARRSGSEDPPFDKHVSARTVWERIGREG